MVAAPGFFLANLDTADYGLIGGADGEGDDDLSAAVGRCGEGLDQRRIDPDGSVDVEIAQYRRSVDGHVEDAVARSRKVGFCEVQQDGVLHACGESRNCI